MHRQLGEHAPAGRQAPHLPAPGLEARGPGFLHFPEHVPQGQGTGRGLDAAGIFPFQPHQRVHRRHALRGRQHDFLAMRAARPHGHGVVGADPGQPHVIQQKANRAFQIVHVVLVHRHAGGDRQAGRFQQAQAAQRPFKAPVAPRRIVYRRAGTIDRNLDRIQPAAAPLPHQFPHRLVRDQRAVGQQAVAHAPVDQRIHQFPQIRPQEDLAAAQRQPPDRQGFQLGKKRFPPVGRQIGATHHLVGVKAVGAVQIASAGQRQIEVPRRFLQFGTVLRRQRNRSRRVQRLGKTVPPQFFGKFRGIGPDRLGQRNVVSAGQRLRQVLGPGGTIHGVPDGMSGAVDDLFPAGIRIEQDEVVPLPAHGHLRPPAPAGRGPVRTHAPGPDGAGAYSGTISFRTERIRSTWNASPA